jgi:hypothetical protein
VEARNLFWFLLSVALLPLTRRRFRLTPDGLDGWPPLAARRSCDGTTARLTADRMTARAKARISAYRARLF